MSPYRFRRILAVYLALMITLSPQAFAISIPDEQKMGNEFMEMVQDSGIILHDPVARQMINTVGNHIVDILPPQVFTYDFNMINDDSFNAFASPAANIFVHRGLIAALDTIDEFAGIMAHEVAHATSRHVSESIDRSKLVTIGSFAGMLAGVLIGAAGGGEAASAMTMGSMAAGQSAMLSFTRQNETEADQKAVLFLRKTGYDPNGMLSGLKKMRDVDYWGMDAVPEYFKTHPGTTTRVSHLAGILADYQEPADKPSPPETYDFQMVKYRVIGLYGNPDLYFSKLKAEFSREPDNPALNYGLGLLYARTHQTDLGVGHLQKALSINVFDPMILLELGRIYIQNGDYGKALSVLEGVKEDKVMGLLATYYTAVAQVEMGNLKEAETLLALVLKREPLAYPRANYHLAKIMSQNANAPMSHYYLGIYYTGINDFKNGFRHLNRAIDTLEDPKIKEDAEKRLQSLSDRAKRMKQP